MSWLGRLCHCLGKQACSPRCGRAAESQQPLANAPPGICAVGSMSPHQLQKVVAAMAEGLMVHSEETCSALVDRVMMTEQADYFSYLHTTLC